mgnify:CR=1 FL=1
MLTEAKDRSELMVDLAYAALYFASDESAWVTGTDLTVDGGDAAMAQFPDKQLP